MKNQTAKYVSMNQKVIFVLLKTEIAGVGALPALDH